MPDTPLTWKCKPFEKRAGHNKDPKSSVDAQGPYGGRGGKRVGTASAAHRK